LHRLKDFSDYKRYLTNSVRETQYINMGRANKFLSDLVKDGIIEKEALPHLSGIESTDYIVQSINNDVIKRLEEYEFDKYFKYFDMYKINTIDWNIINSFKNNNNDNDNDDEYKYIYDLHSIKNPIFKEFENTIDFKIPLIITQDTNYSKVLKYPIIISEKQVEIEIFEL
jgi:hypothetical protein